MAMLSRSVCGIKQKTIILNFPGSAKAALECFGFVKNALPHAVALVRDDRASIVKDHAVLQQQSRSKVSYLSVRCQRQLSCQCKSDVSQVVTYTTV